MLKHNPEIAPAEILKIQYPLVSTEEDVMLLVYNEDKSVLERVAYNLFYTAVDDDVCDYLEMNAKMYILGYFKDNQLHITEFLSEYDYPEW